jgi:voltage-gated potassium channel
MTRTALQNKLHEVIFGTETPAGKSFDLFLIVAICLSVLAVIIDSINVFSTRYDTALLIIEWFFTLLFTMEYVARIYCSPHPARYAKSFYGIVDICSIIPTYLSLFLGGAQYFLIIRLLRVLRLFRILKLFRYTGEANVLVRSMWQSRRKILLFLSTVLVIATIFGAFMFLIEGPENGFTSIPESVYWAVVTITTVGYGDISPHTPLGKVIASLVMVLGYSIIAVPTGILTAELANEMRIDRSNNKCGSCGRAGHETDAMHCKYCGETV